MSNPGASYRRRWLSVAGLMMLAAMLPTAVLAQSAPGIGILGDSASDEYRADNNRGGAYAATTFNWMELLARYRGLDFGPWGTRSAPRRTGYAYNWAISGATSAEVISGGQAAGLAGQVAAGQVSTVVVMVGANDFALWNGTYAEVYDGSVSGTALTGKISGIVSNIRLATETVQAAGPVTIFVATLADRSTTPAFEAAFPDPVKRQRVTAAIVAVNNALRAMALQRGAVILDVFSLGETLLARIDEYGHLDVGGEAISLAEPGDEPHHLVLGDNEHGGTVASGLLANFIIQSLNTAGFGFAPFSDLEILNNAGIFPDTAVPSVILTSPANGAVVSGSVSLTATAADNVGVVGVQFKLDGSNLGSEDTSAPYSRTWTTTVQQSGSHTLTAVARDAAGNTATAVTVTVTVNNADTTPPTVSLTAPANGAKVVGALTVKASASDNVGVAGVTFLRNGVALGPEDTSAPYSIIVQTDYTQNGTSTLVARARDAAGNLRSSTARTVTIANPVPDTIAPTVTVTNPPAGSTVSDVLTVSATASDNVGVAGVRFKVDGADLGAEDTVAPFAVSWTTTTVSNGSHTLSATARDAAGNTTTAAAVSVVVNNGTAQFLSPGAYSVTRGAYQSGTIGSVATDDNGYLAVRSATSGLTGYATTDFEFVGVSSTASRLDFSVVVKSSASSTTVRLYVFQVSSQSWIQLSSSTVGTSESRKDVSITAGASGYRDTAGRVRLRVEGSKLFSSVTVSHELISLTARN
jgi:hypothetical protein